MSGPTDGQRAFQDYELGLFIHLGLCTYTGKASGDKEDPKEIFNPYKL